MFFFVFISLLILQNSESQQLVGPKEVTGLVDGSVTIKCFYSTLTKANKYERKFFCREGGRRRSCDTIVSTNNYVAEDFKGRATIIDNNNEGSITVEISGLQLSNIGTYRCGIGSVTNGLTAVISLAVTQDSTIPAGAQLVYGQLRSTVTFLCDIGDQYASLRKYLCRIGKSGCTNIVDSTGNMAAEYQGRIMLSSGREAGSFTVKLIQLRKEDSGLYSCGFGNYGGGGDSTVFDLRINEETDILQGSRVLTTSLGGSISAQCNYNPKKNYTIKFWCKWGDTSCDPIIKTDGFVQDTFEGRIVIHDDPANGTMQVLMNQLTKEDAGWYWCVLTDGGNDQTSTVQVEIVEGNSDRLAGNKTFFVPAGKQARIPCSYPCKYTSYQKYWCKWSNFGCDPLTSEDEEQSGLSVTCDTQELVLNIIAVTKKDEGWYWCGVRKLGRFGESLPVRLIVGEAEEKEINTAVRDENIIPNGQSRDAKRGIVSSSSEDLEKTNSSSVLAVSLSICVAVLVALAIFIIVRLRKRKHTELVSVGSYRTDISMTDFDKCSNIGKDNLVADDAQETDISAVQDGPKTNKRASSKEELSYSSFLIYHDEKPNDDTE
ncbi:polymeric immunoglobulin receptor [Spea bombifrons]|uniref:polymeric immunoglobulin receptor n=1 Tax=Spea bombifrons TaxID=233779 RepID=UPI00234985FA|nr:polymeric immunoglobulin receptor [Spea bombifrons]